MSENREHTIQGFCNLCNLENTLTTIEDFWLFPRTRNRTQGWRAGWQNWNICPHCISQHTRTCAHCETIHMINTPEGPKIDQQISELYDEYEVLASGHYSGQYICHECATRETSPYFCCDTCDLVYPAAYRSEYNRDNCRHCQAQANDNDDNFEPDDLDGIYPYNTNILDIYKGFLGKAKDRLFYGVELELYCDGGKYTLQDCADTANEAMRDFAILKEDGSIGIGFETVTVPATLEIHADRWKAFFDKLHPYMKTSEKCGLHVHVSRKPLSQLTIGKLLVFFNTTENRDAIIRIAGRECSRYAAFDASKKLTDATTKKMNELEWGDRYQAINLVKQSTIEFRIFASTTSYSELMMRLQFVAASIEFCQNTSHYKLDWKNFIDFMSTKKRTYPELFRELDADRYFDSNAFLG